MKYYDEPILTRGPEVDIMLLKRKLGFCVLVGLCLMMPGETPAFEVTLKTPICSFTIDEKGEISCNVGVEFALPIPGGFGLSIGHQFQLTPEYSYLIFRNRKHGRDDVFKIPKSGKVELLASEQIVIDKGKRIFTVAPDPERKNCFIVELGDALQKKVDMRLHIADQAELYRLDLGMFRSYLVVKSEGKILTTHKIAGESVWPIDSLEFVAIVNNSSDAKARDLLFHHKRGVKKSPGWINAVSNEKDDVDKLELVLRKIAPQAEGGKFTVGKEVSRVDLGAMKPFLILLDNGFVLARYCDDVEIALLRPETQITISKGTTALQKTIEITPPPWTDDNPIVIGDLYNDVDLSEFIENVRRQEPGITVSDGSRSVLGGLFICFGIPFLVVGGFFGAVVLIGFSCSRRQNDASEQDEDVDEDDSEKDTRPPSIKHISCPNCEKKLRVRAKVASRRLRCPKCRSRIHLDET